jgi:hypothetical protein
MLHKETQNQTFTRPAWDFDDNCAIAHEQAHRARRRKPFKFSTIEGEALRQYMEDRNLDKSGLTGRAA